MAITQVARQPPCSIHCCVQLLEPDSQHPGPRRYAAMPCPTLQELRQHAQQQAEEQLAAEGMSAEEGMRRMSEEFKAGGAELYH